MFYSVTFLPLYDHIFCIITPLYLKCYIMCILHHIVELVRYYCPKNVNFPALLSPKLIKIHRSIWIPSSCRFATFTDLVYYSALVLTVSEYHIVSTKAISFSLSYLTFKSQDGLTFPHVTRTFKLFYYYYFS